jgi:thiol-disulfide isomerase/thioredoxin
MLVVICMLLPAGLRAEFDFAELTLEEARRKASAEDKLFFVFFTADWCVLSKWMKENTFSDQALSAYVTEHYVPVRMNIDLPEGRQLMGRFEVVNIPTLLFFSASGKLVGRMEDAFAAADMLAALKAYNLPVNHRNVSVEVAVEAPVLESPRPVFDSPPPPPQAGQQAGFYRPPLVPEGGGELMAARTGAAPSASRYTLELDKLYGDYASAATDANRLGYSFSTKGEVKTVRRGEATYYKVLLGSFAQRQEAERMLTSLQREYISGAIVLLQ